MSKKQCCPYCGSEEEDHWMTKRDVLIMDELGGYDLVEKWKAIDQAKGE